VEALLKQRIQKLYEFIRQDHSLKAKKSVDVFGSYCYTEAKYSSDHKDAAIKGKRAENPTKNIFNGPFCRLTEISY
jgi:hypothetical protein